MYVKKTLISLSIASAMAILAGCDASSLEEKITGNKHEDLRANAGIDVLAIGTSPVALKGIVYAENKLIADMKWVQVAGEPVTGGNMDCAEIKEESLEGVWTAIRSCTMTVTPPRVYEDAQYTFRLSGYSDRGDESSDEVVLTVRGGKTGDIVVSPGKNATVNAGEAITISGEVSSSRALAKIYWAQIGGAPIAELVNADCSVKFTRTEEGKEIHACDLTFTAPADLAADSSAIFRLTGIDQLGDSRYGDVTVQIKVAGGDGDSGDLTVDAGQDEDVMPGAVVERTCGYTGGDFSKGEPKYTWRVVSSTDPMNVPRLTVVGGDMSFTAPTSAEGQVLKLQCMVQDGAGAWASDDVTFRVYGSNDLPPLLANAGSAQSVKSLDAVILDAGQTQDPANVGTAVYYLWEQVSGPEVTLSNATSERASFVAPSVTGTTEMVFRVYVSRSPITDKTKLAASESAETVIVVKP